MTPADHEDEGGFTLIEMLIVIVVLGIMAAIVALSLQGVTGGSGQVACRSNKKIVATALEVQRSQTPSGVAGSNGYVTDITGLVPAYVRSAPSSSRYALALGANTSGAPINPVGGGAPSAFSAGRVLVATDAPTFAIFKDFVAADPCDAIT